MSSEYDPWLETEQEIADLTPEGSKRSIIASIEHDQNWNASIEVLAYHNHDTYGKIERGEFSSKEEAKAWVREMAAKLFAFCCPNA